MSDCNHTFRTEERPARVDCCIHCGALEPVVTIETLQARIEALEAQLTVLREGVQKHKDSFLGKESDIVPEDGELWALLEASDEQQLTALRERMETTNEISFNAVKRGMELEQQLTALREAARDQLPDVSMRSDVHDKLAALLEVCNEK